MTADCLCLRRFNILITVSPIQETVTRKSYLTFVTLLSCNQEKTADFLIYVSISFSTKPYSSLTHFMSSLYYLLPSLPLSIPLSIFLFFTFGLNLIFLQIISFIIYFVDDCQFTVSCFFMLSAVVAWCGHFYTSSEING